MYTDMNQVYELYSILFSKNYRFLDETNASKFKHT